jgi:hypothetical protein
MTSSPKRLPMIDPVGAPYGAEDARQVGGVARAVLAAAVAVGLMGCGDGKPVLPIEFITSSPAERHIMRDTETGCEYFRMGNIFAADSYFPRLGKDGKPMCGAP